MNDQFELYENARKRLKQKKRLYNHFILFLVCSVFFIIINKVLNVGEPYDWFVWAIIGWLFLFTLHFINVFFTNSFMDKEWEHKQIEKLVKKQELKIAQLEKQIEHEQNLKIKSQNFNSENSINNKENAHENHNEK